MIQPGNPLFDKAKNTITIKDHFSKYLSKWPLFLVCIILCVGAGLFYSRYAIPQYIATTSLLLKGMESSAAGSGDLIESAMNGKREINLNNEIMQLSTANLMERTVAKNGFNVSYFIKGRLLNTDIYKAAPFVLIVSTVDSNQTYTFQLKDLDVAGGSFLFGTGKEGKTYSFKWGVPFAISEQRFLFNLKKNIDQKIGGEYIVTWQPIRVAAAGFLKELVIKAFDIKTSVIQLSLKTENLEKGKDVLNALFTEFYLNDIDDRSKLSANTVEFIEERLSLITGELKGVEGSLENYQGSNQLVDIKGQSTQQLENANSSLKTIKDLAVQQGVVSMILDYFSNPSNGSKLVPSSLGLNDGTLSTLIGQYNELQLKKEREAPLVAPNSTVMQDLNTQLANTKSSILESLNSISKTLKLQEGSFQEQNNQYRNFLSTLPHNERVMQEIKRKQGITEGLYLYLLQKREEAAISSTSSKVAHYKQLDMATGYGPVEPNKKNIIIYAALLGLFLAFSIIYILDILNDKINSKDDITSKISPPLLGEINHISKKKQQAITVTDRSLISEQFRAIRTNISFLLKATHEKTILITSSVSAEGKSFISLNLAAVFAIPGKKVALLEFDIRNPAITSRLNINSERGLTDFLSGKTSNISDISYALKEIPTLHIYPCGALLVNPADLLQSDHIAELFNQLKSSYDFIVIDSPPASLVSDAFILGKYSNMVLYIIRQQYTLKKQLEFVTEISNNNTLENVNIVLNDVKKSDKHNYGNYYGYGNA